MWQVALESIYQSASQRPLRPRASLLHLTIRFEGDTSPAQAAQVRAERVVRQRVSRRRRLKRSSSIVTFGYHDSSVVEIGRISRGKHAQERDVLEENDVRRAAKRLVHIEEFLRVVEVDLQACDGM